MPLYNFMREFAGNVFKGLDLTETGERFNASTVLSLAEMNELFGITDDTLPKRQTIRACRKRPTKPGETLYLYTGCMSKECVKLGEAECKEVRPLTLEASGVPGRFFVCLAGVFSFVPLVVDQRFAQADGFKDAAEMMAFFQKTHGLPFTGELITW